MSFLTRKTDPSQPPVLIAMIHVPALPGTPKNSEPMPEIITRVRAEAAILRDVGVDSIMIENMHDRPYLRGHVGPEIIASMTALALAVKDEAAGLPCGRVPALELLG